MEQLIFDEKIDGNNIVWDVITTKNQVVKHFQVECKNGKIFMRMKMRSFPSPSPAGNV